MLPLVRPLPWLSTLALVTSAIALGACGGHVESVADQGPPGPQQQESDHAIFVQADPSAVGGALRLVRVDLASGDAAPFSAPIPGAAVDDQVQIDQVDDRLVATLSSKSGTRVAFALDAAAGNVGSWRELARGRGLTMKTSKDLRLLGYYATDSNDHGVMRVVTYAGTTVVEGDRSQTYEGSVEYPRIEALGPTGLWAVVRMNKQEIELHEISDQGVVGAVHTMPRAEADGQISPAVRCGLPTSLILEGDFPVATWVDTNLTPIDVPGFAGTSEAVDVLDWGATCTTQDVTESSGAHHLSALSDRKVAPLFDYSGERVLDLDDAAYVQGDSATRGAKLVARPSGATLATYVPTAASVTGSQMYGTPQADVSLVRSSMHSARAFVWSVQRYLVDGDAMQSLELDSELWVVDAAGHAATPLRLYTADETNTQAVADPPSFRFTPDGSRLVWVAAGRVHVLDVASQKDTALPGAGFVDGKFD